MGRAKRVIRLQHGQDRFNERIPIGAKSSIDRKVTGKDTAGSWSMFEAHWSLSGGPPCMCITARTSGSLSWKGNMSRRSAMRDSP